ncbi:MAG: DNA-protecting protein DprA, partial [Pseudomonadota bacterium]|nr:DNA-protecting protein DprA [Pseudomonadota bacterium]
FAGEQGRDVFAVPGSPIDPRSHGTGKLIRERATLLMSSSQILEAIRQPYPTPIPSSAFVHLHHKDLSESETMDLENTPQIHNVIIDLARPSPTLVDEIIRRSNCAPATVKAALLDLEVAGRIRHLSGNLVDLSGHD